MNSEIVDVVLGELLKENRTKVINKSKPDLTKNNSHISSTFTTRSVMLSVDNDSISSKICVMFLQRNFHRLAWFEFYKCVSTVIVSFRITNHVNRTAMQEVSMYIIFIYFVMKISDVDCAAFDHFKNQSVTKQLFLAIYNFPISRTHVIRT